MLFRSADCDSDANCNAHTYADSNRNPATDSDSDADTDLNASIERINLRWGDSICEWNESNLWKKLYDNGTRKRHHAKRGIQKKRDHRKDRFCDSL